LSRMKVLHLFSNNKWTGPAEPAVRVVRGLNELGVRADLAVSPNPMDHDHGVSDRAEALGINTITDFTLYKHHNLITNWFDKRALADWLEDRSYDLLHAHMDNDHRVAAGARNRLSGSIPVVRHMYQVEDPAPGWKNWWLYRMNTDAAFTISEQARSRVESAFGLPPERVGRVDVPVDLDRFDPDRDVPEMRSEIGVPADAFLVGVVARIQPRRRFDLLLNALRTLIDRRDDVHCAIIGRGSQKEEVAVEPAREMGLADRVHFPGYLDDDRYVGMLNSLDVKVYLVPGTDGSCRAVRECMAMGLPIVSTKRGILPELIRPGECGTLCDEEPDALADTLEALYEDPVGRDEQGASARAVARNEFSEEKIARRIRDFYRGLLEEGG